LRNAFTPSRPVVEPAMFAGRTKLLRTLIRSIEDQQLHVVLYGERGIGKTSMLHILRQIAQEARYIVRYASCGEDTDFSNFFRAILQDIPLLYHSDYAPTSEEIEEGLSLADLLPETQLSVAQISDVFAKLSRTRVLIILDEFDRANAPHFRRSVAELIKNLSDRSVRVQLVIGGVASNLTELIEHIPSIRRNILGLQVPTMSREEIEELIRNGESVCGLKFTPEAIDLTCESADGLPYLANLFCQHAGIAALDRQAMSVERVDVVEAIGQAAEEIEHRVPSHSKFHIEKAAADGHDHMLGLAARSALHTGGRVVPDKLRQMDSGDDVDALLDLLAKKYHLLAPVPGDLEGAYSFTEEGVPIYLWMRYVQSDVVHAGKARSPVAARRRG
ncbi:MAG: AAA family ATPase, partial [Thermomicrobiales bacterium]